jgi:hypothetical protein
MFTGWMVTTDESSASSVMMATPLIIRGRKIPAQGEIHVQPKHATGSCATDLLGKNVRSVAVDGFYLAARERRERLCID